MHTDKIIYSIIFAILAYIGIRMHRNYMRKNNIKKIDVYGIRRYVRSLGVIITLILFSIISLLLAFVTE